MTVLLRLFGGAQLETGDESMLRGRAAHRRRLALLAILGASPTRGVSRERIIGLVWPDEGTEKGRRQLTEALYVIRKELGETSVETVGEMIRLNDDIVDCDVVRFRQAIANSDLENAAVIYQAPFLDGWYVDDAPEFERWSGEVRDELAEALRSTLSGLAARAEAAGDSAGAVGWLARLAREDPYSPQVAIRLAKALDSIGARANALRALAVHEARLRGDLDLRPSQEVIDLVEALKSTSSSPRLEPTQSRAATTIEPDTYEPSLEPSRTMARDSAPPRSVVRRYGAVAVGAVAFVIGLIAYRLASKSESPTAVGERFDRSHVAVLYFDDHSQGHTLGHIADGLTEELIHQLAMVPTLRVVSRNGVKRFRESPASPDSLAVLLRAGSLVEGSVQQSRDSLRVTVQLIDGNTGLHVESRVFQRPMRELFEMEEDVAASVATALRQRLGATFAMRNLSRGTRSVEALDLLLRSRQLREEAARIGLHPHENDTRSAQRILTSADSLLQLAQVADPRWTRPPLDRGWLRLQRRRIVGAAASRGVVGAAERFANDVLMREPQNAEAFQLRGTARWRLLSAPMSESADSTRAQQAEGDLRTALGLDSTLATGWATLADVLNVRGAIAEADVAASRALAQDAWLEGADETFFFAFASNLMLQRYGAAGRWCQEGQRVYPDSWRFYECELTLMRQDASLTPNATRAWSLVALMDSLDPPDRAKATGHSYSPLYRRGVAAAISARAGDRARAIRELDALRSSVSGDSVLALDLLYEEAAVRFELGQVSDARRLLEALFSARPMLRAQMARLPLIRAVTR
jgi:TolB-like protein/DNA-binding SARP family transcriptional activator